MNHKFKPGAILWRKDTYHLDIMKVIRLTAYTSANGAVHRVYDIEWITEAVKKKVVTSDYFLNKNYELIL